MLAGIFLAVTAASGANCNLGEVIQAQGAQALVCVGSKSEPGRVHKVQRLEPAAGAPGRHPYFSWAEIGRVRIDRVDGRVAEATLIRGSAKAGYKVALD